MGVGDTWAAWLRDQFDQHPTIKRNADLVRAAGEKDNGRPVIDGSTVTQWLKGRPPSYPLARAAAAAFGADMAKAMKAAGYDPIVQVAAKDGARGAEDATVTSATVVGADDDDADVVLFRRPAGIPDEEWERRKPEFERVVRAIGEAVFGETEEPDDV